MSDTLRKSLCLAYVSPSSNRIIYSLQKVQIIKLNVYLQFGSRVSSGSIVSDYGLDDRGSIPGGGKGFFL
jgi:hypothetical protein